MVEIAPIQSIIHQIRGVRVMLDSDLAELYQVKTKVLNQAVKRNGQRFPLDFVFQLSQEEWDCLRSQFVTSNRGVNLGRGGRRILPYAFTEQGVAMLSSVIGSDRAIEVNIQIMRTFVEMRKYALALSPVDNQLDELRSLLLLYMKTNDQRVNDIIRALDTLISIPPKKTSPIGFQPVGRLEPSSS